MRNNTGIIQRKKFAILWCKAIKNPVDGCKIKFIKGKRFNKNWEAQNQNLALKISALHA